jgi:carbonic anhydrase
MSALEPIRERHAELAQNARAVLLPPHRPKVLFIGCVDARLDPISGIGFEVGSALIVRNVAALVFPAPWTSVSREFGERLYRNYKSQTIEAFNKVSQKLLGDSGAHLPSQMRKVKKQLQLIRIAQTVRETAAFMGSFFVPPTFGAALDVYCHYTPTEPGEVREIVVAGHTQCGGVGACWDQNYHPRAHDLRRYLAKPAELRDRFKCEAALTGQDDQAARAEFEQALVKQSLKNLLTYPSVRDGVAAGKLRLNGWMINTATQIVHEMDPKTGVFGPMTPARQKEMLVFGAPMVSG